MLLPVRNIIAVALATLHFHFPLFCWAFQAQMCCVGLRKCKIKLTGKSTVSHYDKSKMEFKI